MDKDKDREKRSLEARADAFSRLKKISLFKTVFSIYFNFDHWLPIFCFQGPDNEGAPYIWMEFRSIRTFDSKDNCKELCPKLFDAVIKLSGLTKEQIHILMGPLEPLQMGHEGAILG